MMHNMHNMHNTKRRTKPHKTHQLLAVGIFGLLVAITAVIIVGHTNGAAMVALCTAIGGLCTLLAALVQSETLKKK